MNSRIRRMRALDQKASFPRSRVRTVFVPLRGVLNVNSES
jgi:hypothetical protein